MIKNVTVINFQMVTLLHFHLKLIICHKVEPKEIMLIVQIHDKNRKFQCLFKNVIT